MVQVGSLSTSLTLESQQFIVGLKKAVDQSAASGKLIEGHLNKIRTAGAAIGVGLTVGAMVAAAKRALEYGSSLAEVAQQLGVTSRELQVFRYAGSQVGIATEQMDTALAKLTKTVGLAKDGQKGQVSTFRELGVSIQDANGKVYTAGQLMPKLADALSKIKDPATRARIEVELFGKTGQKLDTLLSGGSKGINELTVAAQKLGLVLSPDQIKKLDDAADKMASLKQVLEAKIAGAVADNIQTIMSLTNAIAGLAAEFGKHPYLLSILGGGAVGFRFGGPYGALAGAYGGMVLATNADMNSDSRRQHDYENAVKKRNYALKNITKLTSDGGDVNSLAVLDQRQDARDALLEMNRLISLGAGPGKKTAKTAATAMPPDGSLPTARGSGRKATGPTDDDRQKRYDDLMARLMDEQSGYQQQLTTDFLERASIEHGRVEAAGIAYDLERDHEVTEKKLSQAKADALKLTNQQNVQLQIQAIDQQVDNELLRRDREKKQDALDRQTLMLNIQDAMARTAAERRTIQLKILDNEIESQRLAAQEVIDGHHSVEEKAAARATLKSLPGVKEARTGQVNRATMGPIESYLDRIPKTAAEINEAYENIALNGIQSMNDGLAQAVANTLHLKGAAGSLFNQLISDLIRFQLQQAEAKLFGGTGGLLSSLGGIFGGGVPSLSGGIKKLGPSIDSLTGLDTGGSFMVGGKGGIDKNILSINGRPTVRVSQGETITVDRPGNDNQRGGPLVFDLRGAVMTADLLAQMQGMANSAVVLGAGGGAHAALSMAARKRSRSLVR